MRTWLAKWGSSRAVLILRAFAEHFGVREEAPIDITAGDDTMVLSQLKAPRYTLDGLLAGANPENLHGEVDTGRSVGREGW